MQFGLIGSGSWGTALAKILTDNGNNINWWVRNADTVNYISQRRHNPHYLTAAWFNAEKLNLSSNLHYIISNSDTIIIAIPSAFVHSTLSTLNTDALRGKKVISAIKGLVPGSNQLLNDYLADNFGLALPDYFAVSGPCHAEEVAAEKLSYLTFSGVDEATAENIAAHFKTDYINTVINRDIYGVQYAAVVKNIYALGAGIAHGLEYGDNFLSVYISNSANEMVRFLRQVKHDETMESPLYAASVYLGDLLVTCYSLYSRNRTFGNMIGKGYSAKAAMLELNMVAEGYNASRSIHTMAMEKEVHVPIADCIFEILWNHLPAAEGFKKIETLLV